MNTAGAARCQNCGAAVSGRYCAECGQRLEPPLHSLWHFMQVATEDLTHADSRVWRTLGTLLFRPGHLTREFLAGRRVRYLPPVRLYLVISVAFFVVAAAGTRPLHLLELGAEPVAGLQADKAGTGETAEQRAERNCKDVDYQGPWREKLEPQVRRVCRQTTLDGGRALQEAFLHNLPRAMFFFLPLIAGAMKLMYWWPRHYYVEHLLLLVHNHAFVFLIVMLDWAVGALFPALARPLGFGVTLYIVWYLYRSMRFVYGQGHVLTLSKFLLLSFLYVVSAVVTVAFTTVFSALTLT